MNKKTIVIIWISLSILLPILYFGSRAIFKYNTEIESAKIGFEPLPMNQQPREYKLKVERENFINLLGLTIFELVSMSGLLFFVFYKKERHNHI